MTASLSASAKKPNIVLFMTDDMGIECLSTYGSETYKTPVLDEMARQGMKFNHCYSQPLCTPSRVKIMTGRYNFRNYTKFKHLDPSQTTIGHVAKSAGYKTAICGKWQLGAEQDGSFARTYGFDQHCLWYFNQQNFGPRYRGLHSRWRGADFPGGKGRMDNTGCHVPLIVRWNSVVKPGQVTEELVDFSDFFATIKQLTGGQGSKEYAVDGQSLLPLFTGAEDHSPRRYTYCHYDPKWGTPETGQFARTQDYKVYGGGAVYHVAQDYFEKIPLDESSSEAEIEVKALTAVLERMKKDGSNPKEHLSRGKNAGTNVKKPKKSNSPQDGK